jgi:hypothetical protein
MGREQINTHATVREARVTIKTVRCARVVKGLSCGAVRGGKHYFLESPEHFFSLENLTLDKARTILEAYKANRIAGLPDWFGRRYPMAATGCIWETSTALDAWRASMFVLKPAAVNLD